MALSSFCRVCILGREREKREGKACSFLLQVRTANSFPSHNLAMIGLHLHDFIIPKFLAEEDGTANKFIAYSRKFPQIHSSGN
jgi:hypothetical protein